MVVSVIGMEPRLADSPHHRWKNSQRVLVNWKFVIVIMTYCDFVNVIDSKLNMGNKTYIYGICQARVHCGVFPGSDFIGDKVFKEQIGNNLVETIGLKNINGTEENSIEMGFEHDETKGGEKAPDRNLSKDDDNDRTNKIDVLTDNPVVGDHPVPLQYQCKKD